MTFVTYSWKGWALLVPEIKGGGNFALQNTAQMTVEIWLADFEPMQLKSMSKPLTQLCCQLQRDQGITKVWFTGSTNWMPLLLLQWKLPLGWDGFRVWGSDFDLGGRSDLRVLCESSAEFQVAVHFLHFLWCGCKPCETSCWAEVGQRGPVMAFFTSVLTEATRTLYHANSCTWHCSCSYYPLLTTEQCDPHKLCKAEPPWRAQCVALKT